jgi:hypothetical protein
MLWWRSPSRMILSGVLATAFGIALIFFLELRGYRSMSYLVSWPALLLLALGSLAALLGGLAWAWRTPIAKLIGVGIAVLVIGALAVRIIPTNIHNWTVSVGFPLATTGLIGALFLVLAVIRWVRVHVAK